MNKKLISLIVTLFIFPLGIVSAQNTTPEVQTTPAPNSINGAFGILLGKRFDPSMVTKILTEQQQSYVGMNKIKLQGTLFQVEPASPDTRFQRYSIKTTNDGLIYAIQANYQYEVELARGKKAGKVKKEKTIRSTCKAAVKALAEEFKQKYGKPRGKGWNGEWYSFRQISEGSDKSLRLYANRCRTGNYSIIYTDIKTQRKTQP